MTFITRYLFITSLAFANLLALQSANSELELSQSGKVLSSTVIAAPDFFDNDEPDNNPLMVRANDLDLRFDLSAVYANQTPFYNQTSSSYSIRAPPIFLLS